MEYDIIGGSTNKKYIVWRKSVNPTTYQTYTETEFESVSLADDEFIIVVNNGGIHDIAWYSRLARQFIGSAFIADLAVKTAHIASAAITNAKIAELAVQAANIANAAISNAKIADLAVDSLKIGDTAITEEKLANLAVTTDKLANLAITNAKIANLAVTNAKIQSMSADKITAGTIEALISVISPEIYSGIYYGSGSNPANIRFGSNINLADFELYRGGASKPMFKVCDDLSMLLLQALNSSNVLNTFLETNGSTSTPQGTWDLSESTINWGNNYPVARFA